MVEKNRIAARISRGGGIFSRGQCPLAPLTGLSYRVQACTVPYRLPMNELWAGDELKPGYKLQYSSPSPSPSQGQGSRVRDQHGNSNTSQLTCLHSLTLQPINVLITVNYYQCDNKRHVSSFRITLLISISDDTSRWIVSVLPVLSSFTTPSRTIAGPSILDV